MINLASGRSRIVVLRLLALTTVAGVLVLGIAGLAGAGSPVFDPAPSLTVVPGNVAIPYSTLATPTYVQYEAKYVRSAGDTSALTHSIVSEPVTKDANLNPVTSDFPVGSKIVSVTGCPNVTYRNTLRGLTCDFGTLRQGAVIDLTIVVQTPPSGADTSMRNMAVLIFKEGTNDSQPQSSFTDSVFTNPIETQLTTDTANAFNTFALSTTTTGSFLTASGGNGNYQQSAVSWSGVTGFPGGLLRLQECGRPDLSGSSACAADIPNPCAPLTCATQTSIVVVPGSGTAFSQQNPMTITLTFFASELPAKFNLSQFVIYHDGFPVSSCKAKTLTDPKLDCLLSLTQSKTPPLDVTAVITGPANGGWGGI
jgi:hypothetical protein